MRSWVLLAVLAASPALALTPAVEEAPPQRSALDKEAEGKLRGILDDLMKLARQSRWGGDRLVGGVQFVYHTWADLDNEVFPKGVVAAAIGARPGVGEDSVVRASVEIFYATKADDSRLEERCKLGYVLAHELSHIIKRHGVRGQAERAKLGKAWVAAHPKVRQRIRRLDELRKKGLPDVESETEVAYEVDRGIEDDFAKVQKRYEAEADVHADKLIGATACRTLPPGTLSGAMDELDWMTKPDMLHYAGDDTTHDPQRVRSERLFMSRLMKYFE